MSRSKPSNPSSMKRSCQRQTQVLDLPVCRMIAFVPTPSAVNSTISARQTCFCGALRSWMRALSRPRSADETVSDLPARIAQTRTPSPLWESLPGLKCQVQTTRCRTRRRSFDPKPPSLAVALAARMWHGADYRHCITGVTYHRDPIVDICLKPSNANTRSRMKAWLTATRRAATRASPPGRTAYSPTRGRSATYAWQIDHVGVFRTYRA